MEISRDQAVDCFASDDLIGLGMEADAVRRGRHPEDVVTYATAGTVSLNQPAEELYARLSDAVRGGETTACLVVDATEGEGFSHFEEALAGVRKHFPSLRLLALSTAQILEISGHSHLPLGEVLTRLHAAGLNAFRGDDLCVVHDESGTFVPLQSWLEVHRLAHERGIQSTAGLVFGAGESFEQRVDHLVAIGSLQAQTGGFLAFTPRSYKPRTARSEFEEPTAVEYLQTLAVSRMVLDTIDNIESSCAEQGLKVTQMALRFGANDAGLVRPAETGKRQAFTEEDLRRLIRDAGLRPVERDPLYQTVFLSS